MQFDDPRQFRSCVDCLICELLVRHLWCWIWFLVVLNTDNNSRGSSVLQNLCLGVYVLINVAFTRRVGYSSIQVQDLYVVLKLVTLLSNF